MQDLQHVLSPPSKIVSTVSYPILTQTGSNTILDLSAMNDITLSYDHKTLWLGPGARWGEVYHALEPCKFTVPGGRVADVGVGC